MAWLIGFDLVDDTNRIESSLHCNDITPIISATRCQRHFIKSCLLVGTCYNFLPLPPVKLVNDSGVLLHECNDIEPRPGNSFNQLAFLRPSTWNNDGLEENPRYRRQ